MILFNGCMLSHQTDRSYGRVESTNGRMERTLLEKLDLHKFPRPNIVQKSANYEESRPRAKIINTAFAPHFTWGCKFGDECVIYHLCLRPWFLVVCTFPCSERNKISNFSTDDWTRECFMLERQVSVGLDRPVKEDHLALEVDHVFRKISTRPMRSVSVIFLLNF